jgi:hypothetical protein
MSAPGWSSGLGALAGHAPLVLAIIACAYVVLIGLAAVVGTLHPDEKRRADGQKVLERLLLYGRRSTDL